MRKRILITGASGGLGSVLYEKWKDKYEVLGLAYANPAAHFTVMNLIEPAPILECVQRFRPDLIVHTVGLTNVDLCDQNPEMALDVNVRTTLNVRLAAESVGCKVIHISTNDVFGGEKGLYTEVDIPAPINFYSHTKLMAEKMFYGYENSLILRFTILSWYASGKTTFARWIVDSLRAKQPINLFEDQFSSPIYVSTLADWIERLFDATGIYHLGSEKRSRHACGLAIVQALNLDASLVNTAKINSVNFGAPRPLDVSLDVELVKSDWGLETSFEDELEKLIQGLPPVCL